MPQGDADPVELDESAFVTPGTVLGDYEVVRALGKGGMATVYEARHRALHKRVALKLLHLGHGDRRADLSRRFLREAENAARLSHPHAVDVSHVGTARNLPYLVMEYLEGEDLGQYLERAGKLSVEATADLLVPVTCAIAAAHENGVVHRDLKPQNIFLCKARGGGPSHPKVVDFGVSKLLDSQSLSLTGSDAIIGTPFYMSPEQAMEARHVDARTDQFSLGVILYECVTGHRPFAGDSLFSVLTAIVHMRQDPPSSLSYPMDPQFEALVERALEKKPEARFASMQELGRELLKFASLRVQVSAAAELGVKPADAPVHALRGSSDSAAPVRVQSSVPSRAEVVAKGLARGPGQKASARWPRWAGGLAAGLALLGTSVWLALPTAEPAHQPPPQPPLAAGRRAEPEPAAVQGSADWEKPAPPLAAQPSEPQPMEPQREPAASAASPTPWLDDAGTRSHRQHAGASSEPMLRGRAVVPSANTASPANLAPSALAPARNEPAQPSAPSSGTESAPSGRPAAAKGEFQAFPAARGSKRAVRPLDQRDPWK
jgi:serine/threonine-protein kinase